MYDITAPFFWYKIVFIFELVLAEGLVTYTLNKRSKFFLRILVSLVIFVGIGFAVPILYYNAVYSSVLFVFLFFISILLLKFCYNESWFNIMYCAIMAYTAQHIAYVTCYFITNILDIGTYSVYGSEQMNEITWYSTLVYAISYAIVYWFIWSFISHRIRKQEKLKLDNVAMLVFASTILLFDIVLNAVVVYDNKVQELGTLITVFFLYDFISCSLAIGIQFAMLKNKLLSDEIETINKLWQKDKQLYEIKKENIDIINVKCHDLRHRLRQVRKSNTYDGQTLKEIENAIGIYDSFINTGNEVLDVVLSEESLYCQKNGIVLLCNVDGLPLNNFLAGDLYSIFANAVHNACEATKKVSDETKKIVKVKVMQIGEMVSIHVENYFNNDNLRFENGLPITTKKNKDYHGLGAKSILLVVQKLNGGFNITTNEDVFNVDIMIPFPRENK